MFGRHNAELARALRAGRWERTPEGIHVPQMGALLSGEFRWTGKYGNRRQRNVITDGGLSQIGAMLTGVTSFGTANYIAPYGFDVAPTRFWTVVAGMWLAGELGDAPEGYAESGRVPWNAVNEGGNVVGNTASPAVITIATATSLDVYGFGICTDTSAKQANFPALFPFVGGVEALDNESLTFGPYLSPYGVIRAGQTLAADGNIVWIDPNNDDFFDAGSGHWIDPSTDALCVSCDGVIPSPGGTMGPTAAELNQVVNSVGYGFNDMLCAVRLSDAPETYGNGDELTVVYTLSLA